MKQVSFRVIMKLASCIMVGSIVILSNCIVLKDEGFAIYLTREDIPPAKMEALSHVEITDKPVISLTDIITYNAETHELKGELFFVPLHLCQPASQLSVPHQ